MARVLAVANILLNGKIIKAGEELPSSKHTAALIKSGDAREDDKAAKPATAPASTSSVVILGEEKKQLVKAKPVGVWTHDAASLAGKKLDVLNAMVAQIDPSVKPFKTTQEAIALLSSEAPE